MNSITVEGLTKRHGRVIAVNDQVQRDLRSEFAGEAELTERQQQIDAYRELSASLAFDDAQTANPEGSGRAVRS